jgi:hypothetical protein
LIDGVTGGNEFRTGDYQGFWGTDLIAEVTFDEPRNLQEIGIRCLQDMKSWIFYPSSIEIEISHDGETFEKLAPIATNKPYVFQCHNTAVYSKFHHLCWSYTPRIFPNT